MKNIITVAALLAAGTAFSNAATVVLESVLTPTDPSGESLSAWDAINGKSAVDSSLGSAGSGSYQWLISNGSEKKNLVLADMWGADSLTEGVSYALTSLSYITRLNNANQHTNYVVQVQDSSGNVIGYSTGAIDYSNTGTTSVFGYATVSFDNLVLDVNTAYQFYFGTLSDDTFTLCKAGGSTAEGLGAISPSNSYTLDGTTGYGAVVQVSLTAIPEPSAFGLLAGVGALALVASRRRRTK